jgi:Fibronectin type III domain
MDQTNQEVSVRRGPRFPLSLRFWWGIGLALAVGVWTTPVEAASVSLTVLGSPNLGQPWAVQATTNARGSVSVQFWINGALAQTESVTPYCSFGDPGTACTRVQQPAGSYTVQARVLSNGTEVARQAIVINATGATTTSSSTTASLSWTPPTTTTGVAGYNVYVGTASGVYGPPINAGNVTSYVVNNLVIGNTYYFVVTGYNASGVESPSSNEVSKSIY